MQAIRQSITKSEIFVVVAGFSKIPKNLSHLLLLFCSEPAKKFAKIDYARAQPSFCSLNLLLGDVPVSVAVLICLSSPIRLLHKELKEEANVVFDYLTPGAHEANAVRTSLLPVNSII